MHIIKGIPLLLFAGRNRCPDAFAPAHTSIAASTLCYPSVNHHRTNPPLSSIIGRLNTRLSQKSEIILSSFTFESPGQLPGKFMIRWSTHPAQKAIPDFFHRMKITFGSKIISTVHRLKQLFKPFKQFICPSRKLFDLMLSKETNLSNQSDEPCNTEAEHQTSGHICGMLPNSRRQ